MHSKDSRHVEYFLSIFENPSKAYKTVLRITSEFGLLNEFKDSLNVLCRQLKSSANPDTALFYFYDFLGHSTAKSIIFELIRSYENAGTMLFGIFSQSNTLSMTLIKNPEYFSWLMENETLSSNKDCRQYSHEIENLLRNAKDSEHKKYLLRRYRKREYLRIGTKEIIEAVDFITIMNELSGLAKALIASSIEIAYDELKKTVPEADKNICVIALGKLGTSELNFSSDIDIIFVHGDDKKIAYYHKLAVKTISILSDRNFEGFLYRVDIRLRPGGKNAPISLDINGYKRYYMSFGQLWERMALLKAKPIAGDMKLGRQLLDEISPFIYKKSIDLSYIEEIRRLLFKIKKYVRNTDSELIDKEKIDVKKGTGGIREVEFIVNYFQLIYSGDKDLRNTSMINALLILKSKEYLPAENVDLLFEAYLFLRKIEHKIQLRNEMQTQKLPETDRELAHFAKSLHLPLNEFIKKYNHITDGVHNLFTSIFIESGDIPVFGFTEDLEGVLKEKGVKDASHSANLISKIAQKWAAKGFDRSKINALFNYTFRFIANEELLIRAINGFDMVNPSYVLTVYEKHSIFNILLKLFSVGYAGIIHKNRALMEEFFLIDEPVKITEISKSEKLRLEFAITLKILAGNFDLSLFKVLSEFADRFIDKTIKDCGVNEIAVVGYGKLGISELFIKSDLDLLFISHNAKKPATGIQTAVKELRKLFDVDLRLSPFGNEAPVAVDPEYLNNYFEKYARTWEHLAVQKARIVYSDFSSKNIREVYKKYLKTEISGRDILNLKRKIEKTKRNTVSIKSCTGGLMDIEFIAQYLCIKNRCVEMGMSALKLLDKIARMRLLQFEEIEVLRDGYLFYSKIISIIRIIEQCGNINYKNYDILRFMLEDKNIAEKIKKYKNRISAIFDKLFLT